MKKPRRKSSVVETLQDTSYQWEEWKPVYREETSSRINIPGTLACYKPQREKSCLRVFRPGLVQTGLYSHRKMVENLYLYKWNCIIL